VGWRARIGLVYPNDGDSDDDYVAMAPVGVSVHVARNEAPWTGDPVDSVLAHLRDGHIETAAKALLPIHPDAIGYACSSGSFGGGPGYDGRIVEMLERVAGVPATTATTACAVALRALGARSIGVVTPYDTARNEILVGVLEAQGFEVRALEAFPVPPDLLARYESVGLGMVDILNPELAYRLGRRADRPGTDAVLVACTSFKTGPMIEPLEGDLGKPVVTANQAVIWHALRLAGVAAPVPGFGRLFREPLPPGAATRVAG